MIVSSNDCKPVHFSLRDEDSIERIPVVSRKLAHCIGVLSGDTQPFKGLFVQLV